jgi:hypothetical protein
VDSIKAPADSFVTSLTGERNAAAKPTQISPVTSLT